MLDSRKLHTSPSMSLSLTVPCLQKSCSGTHEQLSAKSPESSIAFECFLYLLPSTEVRSHPRALFYLVAAHSVIAPRYGHGVGSSFLPVVLLDRENAPSLKCTAVCHPTSPCLLTPLFQGIMKILAPGPFLSKTTPSQFLEICISV